MSNSKLKPLFTAILHNTKRSGYRMGTELDKNPLTAEQNNYATKIAKAYIICHLDAWPNNPLKKLQLKIAWLVREKMEQVCGILIMTLLRML